MRVLNNRYELIEAIGQGGMGQVWRGRDRELARVVGIKTLPGELSRQPEFRERFQREARAVAALAHPGITVLHDYGRDDDSADPVPYLVMEYVDGQPLSTYIRSGPVPVGRAAAIARDIADALAHSHGLGIVHRDIKPSNVMLTTNDTVKILDFGIARMLADTATRLTTTGRIVGTPAYMSPEQAQGHAVDARADQYSLGCVLFELLTGHTPFTGDSVFAVMNQHLGRPAEPPSQRRAEVPAALDAVVLRMLAKDSEQRYASISDVRSALDAFADRQATYSAPRAAAPNAGGVPARPAAPPTVKSTRAASTPHVPTASAMPSAPPPTAPPAAPPRLVPPTSPPPGSSVQAQPAGPPPAWRQPDPVTYPNPMPHGGWPGSRAPGAYPHHQTPPPYAYGRPPRPGRGWAALALVLMVLSSFSALMPWGSVSVDTDSDAASETYKGYEAYLSIGVLSVAVLASLLFVIGIQVRGANRGGVFFSVLAGIGAGISVVHPAYLIWTVSDARDAGVTLEMVNAVSPTAEAGAYLTLLAAIVACVAGSLAARRAPGNHGYYPR